MIGTFLHGVCTSMTMGVSLYVSVCVCTFAWEMCVCERVIGTSEHKKLPCVCGVCILVSVCLCLCMCARVCWCVCACVRVRERACTCAHTYSYECVQLQCIYG